MEENGVRVQGRQGAYAGIFKGPVELRRVRLGIAVLLEDSRYLRTIDSIFGTRGKQQKEREKQEPEH